MELIEKIKNDEVRGLYMGTSAIFSIPLEENDEIVEIHFWKHWFIQRRQEDPTGHKRWSEEMGVGVDLAAAI